MSLATDLRALRLRTAYRTCLFPASQLRDGRLYPELQGVLTELQSGLDDPWTWAQWFDTRDRHGVSAMDQLWAGGVAAVVRDAGHDAAAWRG